jgi:hypothetical protein
MNGIEKAAGQHGPSHGSQAPERRRVSDMEQNAFAGRAQGKSACDVKDSVPAAQEQDTAALLAEASRSLRSSLGMQMRQTADQMLKENIEE